ncbi:MAG TPA: glycosyltransferase family 39 protein [Gemmatimonadales bacterium]
MPLSEVEPGPGGSLPELPPSRLRAWALWLVLLTAVSRLPLLVHPRAVDDERVYSVVAHEMLDGGKPYRDAIERKPPALFWTYAAIYRVVGKYNWAGLHLAALLWVLLTMAGLYAIGRALFGATAGLIAALLYGVYQPWWPGQTLALNGEVLMNLPLAWGAFLTLRRSASRTRPELLAAGVLFALAFLLKQPAAIAAVPFGVYLLLPAYRKSRGLRPREALLHASLLTLGFFATLGGVLLVLRAQGILAEALYWTIGDHSDPYFNLGNATGYSLAFIAICAPLLIAGARAVRQTRSSAPAAWSGKRAELLALVLWLAVSAVGVAAGGRFYPHYYIQLIPPLALLAAPGLAGFDRMPRRRELLGAVAVTALALTVIHPLRLQRNRNAESLGEFLQANSTPQDRIFVWGQAADLYLEARRRPASRYITSFPLTGYVFGSPRSWDPSFDTSNRILPGAWDNLARDFAAHPPLYIVDTDAARPLPRYPMAGYPYLRDLVATHYRLLRRSRAGLIYRRVDPVIAPHS